MNEKEISEEHRSMYTNFINELTALKTLDHPNIIKLYEVFECENAIYLVQELCDGGELFDYIANKRSLSEQEASMIFQQMVGSIIYCHKNRICHRDLKPENFMLSSTGGDDWSVKLIDFGISRSYFKIDAMSGNQLLRMKSLAGTTPYMAPEIFKRNYSNSCDTWSLGIILFIMLSGYPPFEGYNEEEIADKIVDIDYNFDDPIWGSVSDTAKDLISKMLCDEVERITPKEALAHEWVANSHKFKKLKSNKVLVDRLSKFQNSSKLRKTILSFLASKASDEDMKNEIELFNNIDTNKDGYITLKELKAGLKSYKEIDKEYVCVY
jgi:calcium-dependent protein kinase